MAQYYQVVHSMDEFKRLYPNINLENVQVVVDGQQDQQQLQVLGQPEPQQQQQPELVLTDNNQLQQVIYHSPQQQQPQHTIQTSPEIVDTSQYIIQDDGGMNVQQHHSQQQLYYSEVPAPNDQINRVIEMQTPQQQQQQQQHHTIQHVQDQQPQHILVHSHPQQQHVIMQQTNDLQHQQYQAQLQHQQQQQYALQQQQAVALQQQQQVALQQQQHQQQQTQHLVVQQQQPHPQLAALQQTQQRKIIITTPPQHPQHPQQRQMPQQVIGQPQQKQYYFLPKVVQARPQQMQQHQQCQQPQQMQQIMHHTPQRPTQQVQVVQTNQAQHIQHLLQQQQQSQRVTIRPQMVPNVPSQHARIITQQPPQPIQRTPQLPAKIRQPRTPRPPKVVTTPNGATTVRAVRAPGGVGLVRFAGAARPQQQGQTTYRLATVQTAAQPQHVQQPRAIGQLQKIQQPGQVMGDAVQPPPPVITKITQNPRKAFVQPQQKAANSNSAGLEDLEESITAAVVAKFPSSDELADNDDENKTVHLSDGTTMSLAEYNRKYINVDKGQVKPQQQQPALQQQQTHSPQQQMAMANQQLRQQTVLQKPHNNIPGQDLETRERESARMLVILENGEQRLITFTLPKESCTVQELLEQVNVPFSADSNIQCISNPGGQIDYIVTVNVAVQDNSDLITAAENTMKQPQVQEQLQINQQQHRHQYQQQHMQQQHHQQQMQTQQQQQQHQKLLMQQQQQMNQQQQITQQSQQVQQQPPKTTSPEPKRVESKFKSGFLAVCSSCGYSGYNFATCDRCHRIFPEEPRAVQIQQPQTHSNAGGSNPPHKTNLATVTTKMPFDKLPKSENDKKQIELLQKKYQQDLVAGRGRAMITGPTTAARGGRQNTNPTRPARGRGARTKAEAEPVILTLSSDEEDDDAKKQLKNKTDDKSNQSTPPKPEPLPSEPVILENYIEIADFVRADVTDIKNSPDGIFTSFPCRTIRIGSHKFDPKEKVTCTSKGIRIVAPGVKNPNEQVILDIQHSEIVKVLISFNKQLNVMFLYTKPSCSAFIRESLEMGMPNDNIPYYNSLSRIEMFKRITLLMESMATEAKSVIKSIFNPTILEEVPIRDANELLIRSSPKEIISPNNNGNSKNNSMSLNPQDIRKILIYPQGKGGISINTEDYMCLAIDQYLNDVIIDFYLNYLRLEVLNEQQKERTHVFSTFFYKRLTTVPRQKAVQGDPKLTAAQKRHERVKNWTKNVNLFEKEFIIIPINEQSHWFLAIICYPGLMGPETYDTGVKVKTPLPIIKKKPTKKQISLQIGNTTITPVSKREQQSIQDSINLNDDDMSERDEAEGDESELGLSDAESGADDMEEEEEPEYKGIKQPCILIFDSLAGASRSRVVATLRDYLTCEYKAKVLQQTTHTFNKDNMPGCCVKVPQQNNFTDCGLYLLQYVEEFFSQPIKDFRLPVRSLQNWFETIVVTRKREEIAFLIQELVTKLNPSYNHSLPEIQFPTLNGKLLEREEDDETADFEEEELDDDARDPSYSTENESSPEKGTSKTRRNNTMASNSDMNQQGSSMGTTKKTLFKRTLEDKPRADTSATRKRNRISET